jgi:hypothetical protein
VRPSPSSISSFSGNNPSSEQSGALPNHATGRRPSFSIPEDLQQSFDVLLPLSQLEGADVPRRVQEYRLSTLVQWVEDQIPGNPALVWRNATRILGGQLDAARQQLHPPQLAVGEPSRHDPRSIANALDPQHAVPEHASTYPGHATQTVDPAHMVAQAHRTQTHNAVHLPLGIQTSSSVNIPYQPNSAADHEPRQHRSLPQSQDDLIPPQQGNPVNFRTNLIVTVTPTSNRGIGNTDTSGVMVSPSYLKVWPPETPLQFDPNYQGRLPAGFAPDGRVENRRGPDGRIVQHYLRNEDSESGNAEDQVEDDLMKSFGKGKN